MSILGYRQIIESDTAASLPTALTGDVAYAWDTDRHYRYLSTNTWALIPNQAEMLAILPKVYVNGTLKTNRRLQWADSAVVAGGAGNATFYITSDLTSTGTARATAIDLDTVMARTEDNTGQYAFGVVSSPNVKTVIVNVFKQAFTGAVVLGINLLGSVSNAAAANGTVVKMTLDGDAA